MALTGLHVALRVCERFGQDPLTFVGRLDDWWLGILGEYDRVERELSLRRMGAGVER